MKKSILAAVVILLAIAAYCQEKSDGNTEKLADQISRESTYYGLVIGIDHYQDDSIPNQEHGINKAEDLEEVLTSFYNFKDGDIIFLKDATRADILNGLERLTNMASEDDLVLIYFIGRGSWDREANMGYWLPSDADWVKKLNWFPVTELVDFVKAINSKHTLLIVDASFSGSIFKSRAAVSSNETACEKLYELPSRKAITSTSLNDPPEKGILTTYLLKRLSENRSDCLSSQALFRSLKVAVVNNSQGVAQYGTISRTGDQGGDFIFIRQ